jgi:hypothetical protein
MDSTLVNFFHLFEISFNPPLPYRGQTGKNWLVSKAWSDYLRDWLPRHYMVRFEYPFNDRRRLDAALWSFDQREKQGQGIMDIALEWEWDYNKVAYDFPFGDFRKLLDVDAKSGLAIVQTKVSRRHGMAQADETVRQLQLKYREYRRDSRSVALIEIRRVIHQNERVEFRCYFQDLDTSTKEEIAQWCFP